MRRAGGVKLSRGAISDAPLLIALNRSWIGPRLASVSAGPDDPRLGWLSLPERSSLTRKVSTARLGAARTPLEWEGSFRRCAELSGRLPDSFRKPKGRPASHTKKPDPRAGCQHPGEPTTRAEPSRCDLVVGVSPSSASRQAHQGSVRSCTGTHAERTRCLSYNFWSGIGSDLAYLLSRGRLRGRGPAPGQANPFDLKAPGLESARTGTRCEQPKVWGGGRAVDRSKGEGREPAARAPPDAQIEISGSRTSSTSSRFRGC